MDSMKSVLALLVIPNTCQHISLEQHFEEPDVQRQYALLGRIGTYSLSGRWTDDWGEPHIHGECKGEAWEWRD
jgi:hypothetical protein